MGVIYPRQPQIAVGTVVFSKNKVLLVRRDHPPAKGYWSLPGGVVELGERLTAASEREVFEETSVVVKAEKPIYSFDVVRHDSEGKVLYHYVIIDYLATYIRGDPCPNDDASAARWVSADEFFELSIVPETIKLLKQEFNFTFPGLG